MVWAKCIAATDTKLGRVVALKVLPAGLARDPDRLARFQREARSVAALNHPQIVTLFSVEEAGGARFLTLELVEGQSLDRLIPNGGCPVERISEIASSLAEALAAAHDQGIVHRDLKPANVMMTGDGCIKVLGFGLARETRAANTGDATRTNGRWRGNGNACLYVSRTGRGPAGRSPSGHLFARHYVVRNGNRKTTVSRTVLDVRSDPRFTDLMREANTRWETLGHNLPPPLRLVTAQQAPPKNLHFLVYQACAI